MLFIVEKDKRQDEICSSGRMMMQSFILSAMYCDADHIVGQTGKQRWAQRKASSLQNLHI